jgi:hypothetical protein
MNQSEAWIVQIQSDFAAADLLRDASSRRPELICQAVAKYQQAAEKSIKAMVSAIVDLGITFTTVSKDHVPSKEMSALSTIRGAIDKTSTDHIARILSDKNKAAIHDLCMLAPKFPAPGQPFPRNTEYPFEIMGGWSAPAQGGVFTVEDLNRARDIVWPLQFNVIRFASAVRRGRRQPGE